MKHLIIISILLCYVAGFMIYKFGEWLFNFGVYITTDLDLDHLRVNRQADIFGVQRDLLDFSNRLIKGA